MKENNVCFFVCNISQVKEHDNIVFDFFSFLATSGLLAVSIAIVGWFFIYHNSRALQKRSETWAVVKNITDLLQSIESNSKEFWLENKGDEKNEPVYFEVNINNSLNELERWLKHYSLRVKNNDSQKCRDITVSIFKDSTMDAENQKEMSKNERMKRLKLVQLHTNNMKCIIDASFEKTYL